MGDELPTQTRQTEHIDLREIQRLSHEQRMRLFADKREQLTPRVQLSGTIQELGELSSAHDKNQFYDDADFSDEHIKKEIGDIVIYLCGYASLQGYDIEECIQLAASDFINRETPSGKAD